MATISSHYFRECIQGAKRRGVDTGRLLREAGVDAAILADPAARGDTVAMARLVRGICHALQDEFMGFTAQPAKPGLFGLMTRVVQSCESLGEALESGAHFYNVVRDDVAMRITKQGRLAVFEVRFARPECDPVHYFLEFWMVIWHRFGSWLTGGPIPLAWAAFEFGRPDAYMEEFKYLFPCPLRFHAKTNAFAFEAVHLRTPVVRTPREVENFLAQAPLDFMTMPGADHSLARRIRTALLPRQGGPVRFPDIAATAARFNMTPQTLRRKLKEESSSYRLIKENIRRDIAIQKVLRGEMPIEEIAGTVGYSEARSFTRAFHAWTGLSPVQYRAKFRRAG
jgi:AraC-like DNA-binding protein